jgi:hypothetical protein
MQRSALPAICSSVIETQHRACAPALRQQLAIPYRILRPPAAGGAVGQPRRNGRLRIESGVLYAHHDRWHLPRPPMPVIPARHALNRFDMDRPAFVVGLCVGRKHMPLCLRSYSLYCSRVPRIEEATVRAQIDRLLQMGIVDDGDANDTLGPGVSIRQVKCKTCPCVFAR